MQTKYSFDKTTLIKIGKGALITFTGAGTIAVLGYIGALNIENPTLAGLIALIIPVLVNTIREWMKGE
jgi:hypothetical protein